MKLNLFSIPIYIGNIDVDKIVIENKGFKKTWYSKTESSYSYQNIVNQKSGEYILETINSLMGNDLPPHKTYKLLNIWENKYESGDFQERHVHAQSHFSFVIYKKIESSKTVFFNPSEKLMSSYYGEHFINNSNFFKEQFIPQCRQGQIIVFPSFIEHMVQKHNNSKTIAGNVLITLLD
tara:strand:+ start:549 stop:1085 length:537 start_codon:yes stop_codon:yes gene_type:complete